MSPGHNTVPIEDAQPILAAGTGHDRYDQPIEENEKISIVIHDRTPAVPSNTDERFKLLNDALKEKAGDQFQAPKIQRVPVMLKENQKFTKYYEPRVVAVGPIHHSNPKLQPAEQLKLRLANGFIDANCKNKSEELYKTIRNEIDELKKCYVDDAIEFYDADELAWMFFIDGCAILQFIYCVTLQKEEEREDKLDFFMIKNHHVAFAQQDLFLLENQLPYRVLELLINSTTDPNSVKKSITTFINENLMMNPEETDQKEMMSQEEANKNKMSPEEANRKKMSPEEANPKKKMSPEEANPKKKMSPAEANHQQEIPEPPKHHLLDLLRTRIIGKQQKQQPKGDFFCGKVLKRCTAHSTNKIPSFRNVKELQAAGIRLRPCKIQKTSSLTEVSFNRMFCIGTLRLHPLVVDDSTAPKFLNLVAYEMCPDFRNNFEIASYVCFLDSLIDEPGDVKELRDAGILHNAMGSDEEVAILFNEISTDLVPNPHKYSDIKNRIQRHCDNRLTKWMAEFLYTHFSSPWSFLAFFGAIFALALSFLQTWQSMTEDPCKCVSPK